MKLTKLQMRALNLLDHRDNGVALLEGKNHEIGVDLVVMGLASYQGMHYFQITPAGRQALKGGGE